MQEDIARFEEFISKYDRFIISTHESPDWDGLGAEIALDELLKKLGKITIIINSDPTPETFLFLDPDNDIKILNDTLTLPGDIGEYAQFVLDTNDYDNIGSASKVLGKLVKDIFIIDHHEIEPDRGGNHIFRADVSSASELIFGLITHYRHALSLRAAQALFAGIVYDTGSFIYPKTSPHTFRMAADLESLGVVPSFIHEQLYEQHAMTSFQLRSQIISTMEVLYGGRLIAMKLTPDILKRTGSKFTEGEPAINMPLIIKGVVASLLVKQDVEGPVKVSLRTKGDIDVARLAMDNGGGGHKNAAGYKSKESFDETYRKAVLDMKRFFK